MVFSYLSKNQLRSDIGNAGEEQLVLICKGYWCDDCVGVQPLYESLAQKFAGKGKFGVVDVDLIQFKDYWSEELGVVEAPTFVFYRKSLKGDGIERTLLRGSDPERLKENMAAFFGGEEMPVYQSKESEVAYDLVVIGGGSGGLQCAKLAKGWGLQRVLVLDYVVPSPNHGTVYGLGGCCANKGCVPKFLFHMAGIKNQFMRKTAEFYGFEGKITHNWETLSKYVNLHIGKLNWKHRKALRESGVEFCRGLGTYLGQENDLHRIQIQQDEKLPRTISSKHVLISTGSRPSIPSVPGGQLALTSDEIFGLKHSPGKTLVVGGGYIGVETASFLSELGCNVTLSSRDKLLKRGFDEECVSRVQTQLKKHGVEILIGNIPTNLSRNGDLIDVTFQDGTVKQFQTVLYAIGRNPSSSVVKGTDVKIDREGRIVVNQYFETNVPGLYAVGDVCSLFDDLTPLANFGGRLVATQISGLKRKNVKVNHIAETTPTTLFATNLEYGKIGLSEEDAKIFYSKQDIIVYKKEVRILELEINPDCDDRAFGKLICKRDGNGKETIIGFHYVGPNAGEITQQFSLAYKQGITKDELDECIQLHPTISELFLNLVYGVHEDTGCGC